MRRSLLITLFLIVSLTACTATPLAPTAAKITDTPIPRGVFRRDTLIGMWVGGFTAAGGNTLSVQIEFNSPSSGVISLQPYVQTSALTDVRMVDAQLSFSAQGDEAGFKKIKFAGSFDNGELKGNMSVDEVSAMISFVPIASLTSSALNEYVGVYQFPSGRTVSILPSPAFAFGGLQVYAKGLLVADYESGAMRGLYAVGDSTFLIGSARAIGFPFATEIAFKQNATGKVDGLVWRSLSSAATQDKIATRLQPVVEEIKYQSSDGLAIAARLTRPAGAGRFPVLVMSHGSEPGRRNGFAQQLMYNFMVSQGIALLTYDKRGVGESGGVYQEAAIESNLQTLAADILSGVNYLKTRSDIDQSHIGLIGASQAGWVIPIAAQSADVNFFVIISGPVVSVGHESIYSAYTDNGESTPKATPEEISKQLASLPSSGFNPVPSISKLKQPGLWLWGSNDKSIPIPESVSGLEKIIAQGKTNFSYIVLQKANHGLTLSPNGLTIEAPYSPGFHENYYATLKRWLQQRIKA